MKVIRIAVIGKGPFGLYGTRATTDEERTAYAPLVSRMTQAMAALLDGYDSAEVLTGTAPGSEQLGFWAAYALRRDQGADVTIRLTVPSDADTGCRGLFGPGMVGTMERLADSVVPSVADAQEALERRACRCDALIAVCQPTDAFAESGLGRAMRAASTAGRRIVVVTP